MEKVEKTEEEWQKELSPKQYEVMRQGGTEASFTGKYVHEKSSGIYKCAACGNPLFSSETKFDSKTGWPSFDDVISNENVITRPDTSHGTYRTEVLCAKCGSHLGHLFDDGPTKNGKRYCINSVCLDLEKES